MRSISILLLLAASGPVLAAQADDAARADLLAGVKEITAPRCVPGGLVAFGKDAFVVLTGRVGKARAPLVVATPFGEGRALAVGHEGFFGASLQRPDNLALLKNIARWAGRKPLEGLRVGMLSQAKETLDALTAAGCRVASLRPDDLPARLDDLDLLWMNQASLDGEANRERISAAREWVRKGGGVVVSGPAWGWQQLNPARDLVRDHTGNQLLLPMGLAFSAVSLGSTGPEGYTTEGDTPALAGSAQALDALESHAAGRTKLEAKDLDQVTTAISLAAGVLPEEDTLFIPRVRALCAREGDTLPTKETPVTTAMPFARLKAILDLQRLRRLSPEKVAAHPAAGSFPGSVPADAPREMRTLTLDTRRPAWHGTGLYAAPGEVVTVTLPAGAAGKGLAVRIGAHTDRLWHLDRWARFPEVSLSRRLDAPVTRVASAFGGTIFIDVPGRCALGTLSVSIAGAVAQPRFTRGVTSLDDWRKTVRNAPAPWAELEAHTVILSVPSSCVRDLDDPEALMAYWDEVVAHCHALYAAPPRDRPERYCVDRQISAGYMHSGYPIMTHDDVAQRFCDLTVLRGAEGKGLWGFYHELGHNYQRPEWTWDGMGEVTNNFFSLYAAEKLNGVTVGALSAMTEEQVRKRVETVAAKPGAEAYYRRDPWYPLTMFFLLRREFGWEPFTRVFTELRDLPDVQKPKSDDAKRDEFLLRFSRAVGKNLAPYLTAWGVQTSAQARASLAGLPTWLPPGLESAGR